MTKKDLISMEDSLDMEMVPGEASEAILAPKKAIEDNYLTHLESVADNIDKLVDAKHKIWQAILKMAKPGDWVVFEQNTAEGKKATVCLSGAGADRVASSVGISFTNWEEKRETGTDKKGEWYRYWFTVDASFGGRICRVMGRAGSRDKFFSLAYGKMRDMEDIDESNIRMAAYHNTMKEGVKILLGLRNIPIEEFEKADIKLSYATKISLSPNKSIAVSTINEVVKQKEINKMVLEMGKGDKTKAVNILKTLTRFTTKDGKEIEGVASGTKLTGKRLEVTYSIIKEEYTNWKKI